MRTLYEVRIWKYTELLHKANYEFENEDQANYYALGLYDGFRLTSGATGHGITQIEK